MSLFCDYMYLYFVYISVLRSVERVSSHGKCSAAPPDATQASNRRPPSTARVTCHAAGSGSRDRGAG